MKKQLQFKLLQQASKNYLCQPIPDNWYELSETEQNEFVSQNVWQPLEFWSAAEIYENIENSADSLATFIDKEFPKFVLVAVTAGTIDLDTTKTFSSFDEAEAALNNIKSDFHPESDDLQIIPLSLL